MRVKSATLAAALMCGGSVLLLAGLGAARAADSVVVPNTAQPPMPTTSASEITAGTNPNEPNLDALRYYAAQKDQTRVEAELRRLRAAYPGWQPPADASAQRTFGNPDQALWDLLAKQDIEGLKAAMAERRRQTPDWQPSAELSHKFGLAEANDDLVQASNRKDYSAVVRIAAGTEGLMTCDNLNAMWRTAEALVRTNDEPHALEAYRYILANCTGPQERLATIQKAAELVKSPEAIDELLRMGDVRADGTAEFSDVKLDGLRRRIGDAAAGQTVIPPTKAELDQLATQAHAAGGGKDAELLGWYALKQKDFGAAETWFRTAMQPAPNAKAAEGLVLALRHGKMFEAAQSATTYANLGPANQKLMVETLIAALNKPKISLSLNQLSSLASAIDEEKSSDAAQAFGWSRFKAKDVTQAEAWFKKSMDWQPNQPAAIGLMMAARRLGHAADYAAVVTRYKASFPKVAALEGALKAPGRTTRAAKPSAGGAVHVANAGNDWDESAATIVKTYQSGQADEALAMLEARKAKHAEPAGLSIVRGWALYNKGDWEGARKVFTAASNGSEAEAAAKGLRQIELGYSNPRFR